MSEWYRDEDDEENAVAEAASGINRRGLLTAAARGMTLAASGLLLPAWLAEESAADNHPVRGVQQRKEQRREKARHQKHHNRHRRQSHGKNRAPGFAIIDGIRWGYYSEAGAFDIEFWDRDSDFFGWSRLDSQQVPNDYFVEFRTRDIVGALWINGRYYLEAFNELGTLKVYLGYGGSISSNGWKNGTTVVDVYVLPQGRNAPDMIVDGFKFTVSRNEDDNDYKKPSLTIRKQ